MASSSSSSRSYRYDVFLSFRGDDTRKRFVDHLYKALAEKPIITFKDDKELLPGESISSSLSTAIEESQIALIVFSENYANSSWCLEELTYIMKCEVERGLIVIPIFYDVEPNEVRKQKRKFGEAFARHENENTTKVESWRKALADACNNVGFDCKDRPESEFINEIVDKILDRLSLISYVDEEFVGMKTRIQDLKSQLEIGSDGVRMVGIWGVGGGGKTTLATSVHMEISHYFEGNCIVENVREKSSKDGLEKLQEKILSAVFKKTVKVPSVVEGKCMLRSMLCRRKVLVLLDDVDQLWQLEALAGSRNWFGSGSRIIITTRDEHLLKTHRVDTVCPLRLLSDKEAIQLFNRHARNEKQPIKDYERLSLCVVSYAAGLPLALKVLGSFLEDKNKNQWMSALHRLKDIPEEEIVEKLKISYDGLKRDEKELFLDIACFFRWESTNAAMEIFEACGFFPEIGIEVLRQKSLITINAEYGSFEMHDLVQEMAHYIVRKEHPYNPEKRSRLWKKDEIKNMFLGDATKKSDTIEAIGFSYFDGDDVSHFCKNVSNMKKLRWLWVAPWSQGEYAGDGGPNFLSNELCYIKWNWYPGVSFPDSFQPMKLVVLKLYGGLQKMLWKGYKDLPCLKVLELRSMKNLVSTPDFKGLPSLQKLILEYCYELEEIHPSLGNHTSLEYVSVSSCDMLIKFPTIVHMEKLETLCILGCSNIYEFPEIQAIMKSLVNLSLKDIGIELLPSSIGERCTNLTSLYLQNCDHLKRIEFNMGVLKRLKEFKYNSDFNTQLLLSEMRFHQFPRRLRKLDLSWCGLRDGTILSGIVELPNLKELDLSWNSFSQLDFNLLQLTRLKLLNLTGCKRLKELPKLPSSVVILTANECDSLTTIGDSLTNCKCLCQVSFRGGSIINDGDKVLESMLQGRAIENGTMLLRLEGVEIAKEFTPCLCDGYKCRLELPEKWRNEFCGFLICAVVNSDFDFEEEGVKIAVEQVMSGSMDICQHEVDWEESNCAGKTSNDDIDVVKESADDGEMGEDDIDVVKEESDDDDDEMDDDDDFYVESVGGDRYWTWVGYVSFASLRDSTRTPWWDQTYNQLSFRINYHGKSCSAFGVRLAGKKSKSGSENPTDTSQFSSYTPTLSIDHVSTYGLKINLTS